MNTKLVIFDMDGLMFDTETLCFRCMKEVMEARGYSFTMDYYLTTVGCNGKKTRELAMQQYGEEFPMSEVSEETYAGMRAWVAEHGVPVKPGLPELLQFLHQNEIPCVIASSSKAEVIKGYLEGAGMGKDFVHIVDGTQTERSKPEPDIFLKACADMGVSPKDALVLEDSQNGILAGWRAGIPVICVPDLIVPIPEIREKTAHVCETLFEVIDLIP